MSRWLVLLHHLSRSKRTTWLVLIREEKRKMMQSLIAEKQNAWRESLKLKMSERKLIKAFKPMYIFSTGIWHSNNQLQRSTGVAPVITQHKSSGFLSLRLSKKQNIRAWIHEKIWFTQSNQHGLQVWNTNYVAEATGRVSDAGSVLHFCGRQSFWTLFKLIWSFWYNKDPDSWLAHHSTLCYNLNGKSWILFMLFVKTSCLIFSV